MKHFAAAALATTVLAGPLPGSAVAADLDPVDLPPNYSTFVTVKGGYGASIIDNDFVTRSPAGRTPGSFDDDFIVGAGVEAGLFLTDNIRISAQFNAGRIEHEFERTPVGVFRLDGHTKVYQGFAKVAYETRLEDIGLTAPIFSRSSVFATAGIGFTHLRSKADLFANPFAPGVPFDADEEDTVLSGVVGIGSVYRLTDRIDLVSELNYTFGGDADLGFNIAPGVDAVTETETQALTSQIGIRFRF